MTSRLTPPLQAWFGDEAVELQPLGAGHINTTWRVRSSLGDFVLQQINRQVFAEPLRIAKNQAQLFEAVKRQGGWHYLLPQPVPAVNGETLVFGEADSSTPSAWRLCPYLADTVTLQALTNSVQANAAGRAFGEFQALAQAINPATVQEVISGFLSLIHI